MKSLAVLFLVFLTSTAFGSVRSIMSKQNKDGGLCQVRVIKKGKSYRYHVYSRATNCRKFSYSTRRFSGLVGSARSLHRTCEIRMKGCQAVRGGGKMLGSMAKATVRAGGKVVGGVARGAVNVTKGAGKIVYRGGKAIVKGTVNGVKATGRWLKENRGEQPDWACQQLGDPNCHMGAN